MVEYEIPLSPVYEEGAGPHVEYKNGNLYIVERSGDPPHDLVGLYDGEVERLIQVLTAYLNRDNDGTWSRVDSYDEYGVD